MKPSEVLKKIKAKRDTNAGICSNFKFNSPYSLITCMNKHGISFDQWEHFSGNYSFPVPARYPETAFYLFDKWSMRSKYGKMRWLLLDWLIEQFELKGA